MTIKFERNDITKMHVDAIVNAANNTLLGGSGVDGAIHMAAGPKLLEECRMLGGCETGKAKITKGYNLPAKYVIHTVGPIYIDGKHNEKALLSSCYKSSLAIAKENGLKTIAFPLISAGVFGYPKSEAFDVAVESIKEFFTGNNAEYDMIVTVVLYGHETLRTNLSKVKGLKEYIDDNYVKEKYNILNEKYISDDNIRNRLLRKSNRENKFVKEIVDKTENRSDNKSVKKVSKKSKKESESEILYLDSNVCFFDEVKDEVFENDIKEYAEISLAEQIKNMDKSFSDSLISLIDNKRMKDVDVYNKANIDRKLFSKIRSGGHPSKITAIALCLALELNIKETNNMLQKAGYALSNSEYFDVIIKYHIMKKIFDVTEINKALFDYDQKQIGVA